MTTDLISGDWCVVHSVNVSPVKIIWEIICWSSWCGSDFDCLSKLCVFNKAAFGGGMESHSKADQKANEKNALHHGFWVFILKEELESPWSAATWKKISRQMIVGVKNRLSRPNINSALKRKNHNNWSIHYGNCLVATRDQHKGPEERVSFDHKPNCTESEICRECVNNSNWPLSLFQFWWLFFSIFRVFLLLIPKKTQKSQTYKCSFDNKWELWSRCQKWHGKSFE